MKEFLNKTCGFRVDEISRTVVLLAEEDGVWTDAEPPRTYPLDPADLPRSPSPTLPKTPWEVAWYLLLHNQPDEAEELLRIVVGQSLTAAPS